MFAGLLIGAMLPYWFSGLTMKAVGIAAQGMVVEVRRQLHLHPEILTGARRPDYAACVDISTQAYVTRRQIVIANSGLTRAAARSRA